MPHVVASAHEIGCDQAGRTAIGKSKPLTIQTGYSSELPIWPAQRTRTSPMQSADPDRERRARGDLEVDDQPRPHDAERGHSVTSATYASSSVGSRDATRPTSKPSS